MATFEALPTELILLICQYFDDFDDSLRLRRSCSRLRAILDLPVNRNQVLEKIIKKFDPTQLWDDSIGHALAVLADEATCLNATISDVVCRWHTIKILRTYGLGATEDFEYPWVVKPLVGECATYGGPPLTWAVSKSHEPAVKLLLGKGADVNLYDEEGMTPLRCAAEIGDVRIAQLLLNAGANVDLKDERHGRTPLSWAAGEGHTAIAQQLLDHGADIHSNDNYGRTPLSWAARLGQPEVVKLLLKKGANTESKDRDGLTPLQKTRKAAVIKLLLENGANIESIDDKGATALHVRHRIFEPDLPLVLIDWCLSTGRQHLFNVADRDGYKPLHCLSRTKLDSTAMQRMVAGGADLCALTKSQETSLTLAFYKGPTTKMMSTDRRFERIKALSQSPDSILMPTQQGKLALHLAAEDDDPRILFHLLDNGGLPGLNHADESGLTPFMMLLKAGESSPLKRLLEYPELELGRQEKPAPTELHLAARYSKPEIITAILNRKPDLLKAVDKKGKTPLLYAIDYSRLDNVECILSHGAERNIPVYQDENGLGRNRSILLHQAVLISSVEKVVELLESPDVDLFHQNQSGDTALHLAVQKTPVDRLGEMVKTLLESDKSNQLSRSTNRVGVCALDYALFRRREESIELLVQPRWNPIIGPIGWSTEREQVSMWSDRPWYSDLLSIIDNRRAHYRSVERN
ncbi:hypothetical protein AWENTII_009115 [Aspergillus wentii]